MYVSPYMCQGLVAVTHVAQRETMLEFATSVGLR